MILHVNCGLGNQMFQYAFGESLRLDKGYDVFYDLSWFKRKDRTGTSRALDLNIFNLILKEHKAIINYNFYDQTLFVRIKNKLYREIYRPLVLEKKPFNYDTDLIQSITERSLVFGFFQNEKYFLKNENEIRKYFEFKVPISANALKYKKYVEIPNSVAIHIRRGDFLKYSDFGVCSLEYYQNAINLISSIINDPLFIIFSDDIEWVKNQLPFKNINNVFVEGNSGNYSYEDMRLMSMCSHNIIANSTFSWWGAWLNNNPSKIVIAPSRWYANNLMNDKAYDITPKAWKRI